MEQVIAIPQADSFFGQSDDVVQRHRNNRRGVTGAQQLVKETHRFVPDVNGNSL